MCSAITIVGFITAACIMIYVRFPAFDIPRWLAGTEKIDRFLTKVFRSWGRRKLSIDFERRQKPTEKDHVLCICSGDQTSQFNIDPLRLRRNWTRLWCSKFTHHNGSGGIVGRTGKSIATGETIFRQQFRTVLSYKPNICAANQRNLCKKVSTHSHKYTL